MNNDYVTSLGIRDQLIVKSLDGELIDESVPISILAKWEDGTFTFHPNVSNSTHSLYWTLDEVADPLVGVDYMQAYPQTDVSDDEYISIDPTATVATLDRGFTWNDIEKIGPIAFHWTEGSDAEE